MSWGTGARGWWKLPAVERVIAAGRRVLWTDDDLESMNGERFAELDGLDTTCLIAPNVNTGLMPRDLRTIGAFLDVEAVARKASV